MSGTISQSGGRLASSPPSAYAMPPHSSVGGASGSRPWMRSQTSDPMTPTLGTERLVQKRLGRPVDTGRAGQLAWHDAAGGHRGLERTPRRLAAERHEQMVARRRDAAAHHHDFGVEHVEQVADADTEEAGGVVHHL